MATDVLGMDQLGLFDDLTRPMGDVAASERGARTPEQLEADARHFFEANPELLRAFNAAGHVANGYGRKVSARQLVELTRCIRQLGGMTTFYRVVQCLDGIRWEGEGDPYAIPNAYSAYLTRELADDGVEVTRAASKLDEVRA